VANKVVVMREDDELMTADEVAGTLKVGAQTVRKWARQGRIPSLTLSKKAVRFRMKDVMDSLAGVQAR